jgi:hypothetical protein
VVAFWIDEARRPRMTDLLARAAENAREWGGDYGFDDVVADIRAMRETRRGA